MSTFIERLETEALELTIKIDKLEGFIKSDAFGAISIVQQRLLEIQISTMKAYLQILIQRVDDLAQED